MKKTVSLLLSALLIVTGAGCSGGNGQPVFDLSPILDTDDYPDKLYSSDESDAELLVFRTGDAYLTYSLDRKMAGWTRTYGDVPDEMKLNDGEFALITADIRRYSGGCSGFMGNPDIRKLKSFAKKTVEEAAEYSSMEAYEKGSAVHYEPLKYGEDYIIINFYSSVIVYRGGRLFGEYSTQIEAEAAMGLREIPDTSVEMERIGDYRLYVFRCGDKYLANCPRIGMNPCWTPYINSDFGNEPENFTLEDGEAAYIMHADIIKLNGGEAGYVDTPMITQTGGIEIVGYDILSDHMPPFWGEHKSVGEGDTVADWIERVDFSENCNAMFERFNGTWLIFFIDGKYYVYLDDYTNKQQIAVCESESEVEKVLKEHRQNGGSL